MSQKSTSDGYSYRDQYESGTLDAADEAVTLACEDRDAFSCQVGAGLTGTLVAELSVDGGTWYATEMASKTDGTVSSSLVDPSAGAYDILRTAGASHVRIRCSARSGGSTAVVLRGTETPPVATGATEATLLAVESAVDGLEALLTTIDGRVDGVEASLTTLAGHVDTLETLLAPPGTIGDGATKTVAAAATPEQLTGSSTPCRAVYLRAPASNTGVVGWGGSGIAGSGGNGPQLGPGDEVWIPVDNANKVYLSAAVNGEGVKWGYVA